MVLNVHRRRDRARCRKARVWLNGQEVTHRCFYADGRRGVVRLYQYENGRPFVDWRTRGTSLSTEELKGHVRFGVKRTSIRALQP